MVTKFWDGQDGHLRFEWDGQDGQDGHLRFEWDGQDGHSEEK